MVTYLLQGVALGFSAAVSPGPFQAYLLSQASAHGWKKTVGAAFAPLLSDGPIILILLVVLAQTPDWFLRGLNLAGGILMLYLAYGALRTFQKYSRQTGAAPAEHNLLKSVLVNALSPGPWIFWSVLAGPILVEAWRTSFADAVLFLFGFYFLLIGGNVLFIALFATARHFGSQITRVLNGIAAIALLIFGLFQIYRGIML